MPGISTRPLDPWMVIEELNEGASPLRRPMFRSGIVPKHRNWPAHLAACALASQDEIGYFSAAAVRHPLRLITGKNYDIPNFARHLNEFTKPERGAILQRTGETRRVRYRFDSPLIKPYIVMRSVADNRLTREVMEEIATTKATREG
jgi:hypothetical protein